MSSLLQFNGRIEGRKVGLQFQRVKRVSYVVGDLDLTREIDCDTYVCPDCERSHARLYEAFRVPASMFGCWVVFRYNGEEHVPDLSIPISVEKLPRDARAMSDAESSAQWHSS